VSAELPRSNFSEEIAIVVLLGNVGVGQLIDVVPEWVLTAGNRVPPALQALLVLLEIFGVILELEGQVIAEKGLLLVRKVDAGHDVPLNLSLRVVDVGVQVIHP
jgi:hypothetical protein